ncbi:D-ribose pyranase [Halobacillus andaensis]|uniref:D-ribose pyranase n=1 Tax=Halobacillus andaensis TaxID=1176239 RepID=A0A917B2M7_HALAA|nr:D-ribose pyranase [Halobacillus andaensis]MBP2004785.1 D-ribose pyranase [Halobacillus andaensis]GGF18910.1 D-ribose pyranase [Halobacillus andaensis]
MKKHGVLNREIAGVLARLGHTDTIVIADCGLPVPDQTKCIDVSLSLGTPGVLQVVRTLMEDMEVEAVTVAEEMESHNKQMFTELHKDFASKDVRSVSHDELKKATKEAKAIIRTGEATPYSNFILHSGVIF